MEGLYYFKTPIEHYNEADVIKNKPLVGQEVDNNFRYIDGNSIDHLFVNNGVLEVFLKKDGDTPSISVPLPEFEEVQLLNDLKDKIYGRSIEHDHSTSNSHDGILERLEYVEQFLSIFGEHKNLDKLIAEKVVDILGHCGGDVNATINEDGCLVLYTKGYIADTKHKTQD